MSTFILEANDTIVMSDSVVMKFTESANACLSCAKESTTNWADLEITKWIMCGIATIVAICVLGYIIVKLIDVCSKACQERKKKEWEEKEADMRETMRRWDEWLRRRLRCYIWKQWKRTYTRKKALVQLGMTEWQAWEMAKSRRSYWRMAGMLSTAISNKRLAQAGYYSILDRYESVHRIYG